MTGIIREKADRNLTPGVAKRSHSALITSTALALLLTGGGGYADAVPVDYTDGIVADQKTKTETGLKIVRSGSQQYGGVAKGNNGILNLSSSEITTNGFQPFAFLAYSGGIINSTNDTINVTGTTAHAVQAGEKGTGHTDYGTSAGTINLTGTTINVVRTGSSWGSGLHAIDAGHIQATDIAIESNTYAILAESESTISVADSVITTTGTDIALVANNDRRKGNIDLDSVGGILDVSHTSVETSGAGARGASAQWGGVIKINGGSITTKGSKAHGIESSNGGTLFAKNVSIEIKSEADQTFGANATGEGSSIDLNGGNITTKGKRGYGLMAQSGGHITSSASVTTHGDGAHAVQAGGNGASTTSFGSTKGTITLTGGTLTVDANDGAGWGAALHAVDTGTIYASNIGIISRSFAALAESGSTITISDSTVQSNGSHTALVANNDRRKDNIDLGSTGGSLIANNTAVTTSGANAYGASAEWGGAVTINGGSITTSGENASALNLINSGTINVTGTELASANAATVQVSLGVLRKDNNKDEDTGAANITLGAGTVATANNGTLVQVTRTDSGADGVVKLTLGAGSITSGDIVDQHHRTTDGGTDVTLQEGASWTGKLLGVRNFEGFKGGSVDFSERVEIAGDLNGLGTSYSFSSQGGTIGGDVNLTDGSSTIGGSIAINDRIFVRGNVGVDDTSTLGGNWFITGNLSSDGILRPGNSIGRVDIGKDLNLSASSVYEVDVDLRGDADLVTVVGTANLDGTVVVTPMDGYKLASPYTILTAGSINGEFQSASLAQQSAFLDANLAHGTNDVTLTIDRNATSFHSVAETSNQAAVAAALDRMELTHPVTGKIALSTSTEARGAFQHLSGDANASVKTGLIETANLTADAINNRLRSAFNGVGAKEMPVLSFAQSANSAAGTAIDGVSSTSPAYNYAFWATGFGSWIDHDGNSNAGGMKTSTGGFLSGLDVGFVSGWRLGLVGGYSETNMDAKGRYASARADNWHLGVYGGNQWGALGVRGGLIHTWHTVDASRSVVYGGLGENLSSDYDARTLHAFAEVGYQIDMAPVSFEPFANLSHVRLRTDGFTESGGDAALAVTSETTNTTFTTLGLRASTPFELGNTVANLKGTIGWRHAYGDRTPIATQAFAGGDAFTVQGIPIAEDAALFEAGLDFDISQAATFGVSYVGQYGSKTTQNGFNATFNVKF